jgi:hypothetical protein
MEISNSPHLVMEWSVVMRLQSLVVGSEEIELSLGLDDGGREYVFVRMPVNDDDFSGLSIDEVRLSMLRRVQDAIEGEIARLNDRSRLRA